MRFNAVKKCLPGCHIESSRDAFKCWEYCGKEDTRIEGPVEWGVPPAAKNIAGNTKKRNQMLLEVGAERAVEEGYCTIKEYPKLKAAMDLYKLVTTKFQDLEALDNHWYVGPPGTGKSRAARANFPDHYIKDPDSFWFTGYNG